MPNKLQKQSKNTIQGYQISKEKLDKIESLLDEEWNTDETTSKININVHNTFFHSNSSKKVSGIIITILTAIGITLKILYEVFSK